MNVFILGANGFIGSHLSEVILKKTNWEIQAVDMRKDKLDDCLNHPRFHFFEADITAQKDWVKAQIQACDVVLPLVAIATPAMYVQDPLRIFELDFETNLEIIRWCVAYQKRVVFPSTSEVYGMSTDPEFDEETSALVTGPIHKERWIYSTSKQMLDRLIYAFGKHKGLVYSLFRPFNWYGPRLDDIFNPKPGGSRVLTQFIGNILRGEDICLVNGGSQQRCMTYIQDGIEALLRIIENKQGCAHNRVFNIGHPGENISIRGLAEKLLFLITQFYPQYAAKAQSTRLVDIDAATYYGEGYQDVSLRVPSIKRAQKYLDWQPEIDITSGLRKTLDFYLTRA